MIEIYDNKFTYHEIKNYYTFLRKSFYMTSDGDEDGGAGEIQLFSNFSEQDSYHMGLTETPFYKSLIEKYQLHNRLLLQTRVNLSFPGEKNRIHSDKGGLTFIYYANPKWEVAWGGHTLIMNENNDDAEKTVLYKPGRCIMFDGTLPHMIMTPSNLCPVARFTYVMQYSELQS